MATKKEPKPIGVVTHYFGGISVAIIKFTKEIDIGTKVHFKGATTDFEEEIKSMQYDHSDIKTAKKGQEVGIKVENKVREGDEVYAVEE
ncbi:MAG: translation elongation factor-like protein [Patescibacteria group bacterium]|nr:translation elongation factor-like protein [Patescibacteria group bacterium]